MKSHKLVTGGGGIAFALFFFAAMIVGNPPGGDYSASDVGAFVAHGHRPAVLASTYLAVGAAAGLIALLSGMREGIVDGVAGRIVWGCGLLGAGALAIGWCISATTPLSMLLGGGKAVDPKVIYQFSQAGLMVGFAAGGVFLGAALVALALGSTQALPSWLRMTTGVAGLLGIASPAFFPFFGVLLWALMAGTWTLTSGDRALRPSPRPATNLN